MNTTTIGIDLAKNSLSLAGTDKHQKVVLRKSLTRKKLLPFTARCPPCLIGLEACSGAHYWAREFEKLGHEVRITKRGDKYLRMCLVHGARAVVADLDDKQDRVSCWLRDLIQRRGHLRAVVALAAWNARLIWTLMVKRENYRAIEA